MAWQTLHNLILIDSVMMMRGASSDFKNAKNGPNPNPNASGLDEGNRGILTGLTPTEAMRKGIDIYDSSHSVEALFGEKPPSGGAFLELVMTWYGAGEVDIPWFFHQGNRGNRGESQLPSAGLMSMEDSQEKDTKQQNMLRSVYRSPYSRELQENTVESYKSRILAESISQMAAGRLTLLSFAVDR